MIGTKRGFDVLDSAGESDRDSNVLRKSAYIYGFGTSFGFEDFVGGVENEANIPVAAAGDKIETSLKEPDAEPKKTSEGEMVTKNDDGVQIEDKVDSVARDNAETEEVGDSKDRDSDDESDEMGYDIGKLLNKINSRSKSSHHGESMSEMDIHVMLIDDSEVVRKMGRARIAGKREHEMWSVTTAETGERASQLIECTGKAPDVIIVDQYLSSAGGKLLGNQWVSKVRRNPIFADTMFIGCSDYTSEARQAFLDAGCDAVWPKPLPLRGVIHDKIKALWKGGLPKKHRSRSDLSAEHDLLLASSHHEHTNGASAGTPAGAGTNISSPQCVRSSAATATALSHTSSAAMKAMIDVKLSLFSQKPIAIVAEVETKTTK
jgi:CheY-like chemotaxis protein